MWWGGSHGDFSQVSMFCLVFLGVCGEERGPHSVSGVPPDEVCEGLVGGF